MSLPSLVPFPPANIRLALGPEEWQACLDAWLTLSELTLRLPNEKFQSTVRDNGSLAAFLTSFYRQSNANEEQLNHTKVLLLRKVCFVLVKRVFTEFSVYSQDLLTLDFLSAFCHAHLKRPGLKELMAVLWSRKSELLISSLQKRKDVVTRAMESSSDTYTFDLNQLTPLMYASPEIGQFFMTGSDFLDSLASAHQSSNESQQRKVLTSIAVLGLESLVLADKPNTSLLSDHLFALKSQADASPEAQTLLADLVTNTSALARLRRSISDKAPERLINLLTTLEVYRAPSIARPKRHPTRRKSEKAPAAAAAAAETMHFHRMTLVTQIQDLFPDLGSGFILKALDVYDDSIEQLTAHLLDDSLPPSLSSLDRTLQATPEISSSNDSTSRLIPHSTPQSTPSFSLPIRKNIFDEDDLLSHRSNLHIGKKPLLPPPPPTSSASATLKSSILSALAAFDSDDDERDDTYDVDDVGGTVDSAAPDGEPSSADRPFNNTSSSSTLTELDVRLYKLFKSSPEIFGRGAEIRRSAARAELRTGTGMTDEGIEGWGLMLTREKGKIRRLEDRIGLEAGGRRDRDGDGGTGGEEDGSDEEGEEEEEGEGDGQGRWGGDRGGGYRGRGMGRGGRGAGRGRGRGGGDGNGPPGASREAHRRKEASKGSRANHNRREGRARKMARGGFGP